MLESLSSQRLIFITGKGGVGKSTACAALGRALAKRGRRVLIVETDTYSAMAELFDTPLSNSTITAARGVDGLWLVNLSAQDALIHAIRQFVPSERVARSVIQNRVASVFFKAAPSVNEFSILNMVRHYIEQKNKDGKPTYDHVIVDLPASGHAVTFLNVPNTLHGMIRIGRLAQICKDLADFIHNPSHTSIVAVCLPEEMPVNETIELADSIHDTLDRHLSCVMLNMVHNEPFSLSHRELFDQMSGHLHDNALSNLEALSPTDRVLRGASLAMEWHDRDLKYTRLLTRKLHDSIEIVELPMLYENTGARVIERLANVINGSDSGEGGDDLAS